MSRKCEHGQFPTACKDCTIAEQRAQIRRYETCLFDADLATHEYLVTIHRLQNRIDALKLQHSRTLCQLVKRSIIGYSQAALKVMRRVRQAVIKVISRESEG